MTANTVLRAMCAAWTGLMAGFFFAFSVVVMPGLATTEPLAAMRAMQAINEAVRNTAFGLAFFGALALSAMVVVQAPFQRTTASWLAAAGGATYLAGVFVTTAAFNVPLNRMLTALDPASVQNAPAMTAYIVDWSAWNDVRTLAGMAACSLLTASLVHGWTAAATRTSLTGRPPTSPNSARASAV